MMNKRLIAVVAVALGASIAPALAANDQPQTTASPRHVRQVHPVRQQPAPVPQNSCDYDRAAGRCMIDLGNGRCMECSGPFN